MATHLEFTNEISLRLVVIIPLLAMHLGLLRLALRDIAPRERTRYLDKSAWQAVAVLVGVIGPVLYFAFGREV